MFSSKITGETDAVSLVEEPRKRCPGREQYGYASLTEIQGWSDAPGGAALFESLLVFENYPTDAFSTNRMEELEIVKFTSKESGKTPDPDELRAFLENALPDYMIPAAFACLSALPLTPNGKIDCNDFLTHATRSIMDFL